VYKGTSLSNSKHKVAIKSFKKKNLYESDSKAIEAEVSVLSKLDHPNIVRFYEAVADEHRIYIVTEYIEGETLAQKLKRMKGRFHEEEAAYILHQLIGAINHCHTNNVVHRDIKPDNIMIDADLNVTLIDFGLSKVFSKKRILKSKAGSPLYMAPEIANEKYTDK
jgi:serine/threonine protein kinase